MNGIITKEILTTIRNHVKNKQSAELRNFLLVECESSYAFKPLVEVLYFDKPNFFAGILNIILNEKNDAIIDAFADACQQTILKNELAVFTSDKKMVQTSMHIDSLSTHAAEIRYDASPRRVYTAAQPYLAYSLPYEMMPPESILSDSEIKAAKQKASLLESLAKDLKQQTADLHRLVKDNKSLSTRDYLQGMKGKVTLLSTLHQHDKILEKHRDKASVICANIASALFLLGIPNLVNKLVHGRFTLFSTTKSMQRITRIDKDISMQAGI